MLILSSIRSLPQRFIGASGVQRLQGNFAYFDGRCVSRGFNGLKRDVVSQTVAWMLSKLAF